MISRRSFFKALVPAAIGGVVLTEELLHPGRVFFLPPRPTLAQGTIGRYTGFDWIEYPPANIEAMKAAMAKQLADAVDQALYDTMAHGMGTVRYSVDETAWGKVMHVRYVPLDQIVRPMAI